jgi:hypothetical protein
VEPWSADDPWQERRDPSPGWDEWPPQAPPTDEYEVGEPAPPASDPWAESWDDDVPGIPTSPPSEFDRDADRPTDQTAEAPSAPADEPPAFEAEPIAEAVPEPIAEAEPTEAPRIEPWSPDPDPWGAAWTMPAAEPEPAPFEEPEPAPIAEVMPEAVAEAEPGPIAEAAPDPVTEPEPLTESEPVAEPEPVAAPEPEPERVADAEPEPISPPPIDAWPVAGAAAEAEAGEEWRELEPDPEPALWSGPAEPSAVDANGDQPSVEAPPPWGAWDADIERAPDATTLPPIWTADEAPVAEEAPLFPEPETDTTWEADLWAEPETDAEQLPEPSVAAGAAAAAAAAEAEPDSPADTDVEAPPGDEAGVAPTPGAAAAAALAAARLSEESAPETPWPEPSDATEVLPTTWAPPPRAPRETDAIEARGGEVRTTLGRGEPVLDGELEEEATTAEQAVPWLIGVILLLAGMVIVLLALIFAGDGSFGGGSDASPSPTVAAFVPGGSGASSAAPSPTPRESAAPSTTASAEPSGSAAAAPEYGDLEMVYQGRSAALAPIYLLRRDFSVEGDPEVLAQDADLNVQRFAWSADGTGGAFLYADLLVGIDPGVDVHALTDGVSAVTFGDDPTMVYAVRVTADGANDVASILAVDRVAGEERELDRVSYPRPTVDEEPALEAAQFSDDGGSVRLYWMHDDTLRLWILGGGVWTIDPAEGNATKADEGTLPVLWAPEGERRIDLVQNGDTTRIRMVDRAGDRLASASVTGRVSHVRWSPRGDQIVFTLGRPTSAGGVLQDLYMWNLGEGEDPAPMQITNTGAAFGAEWLGSQSRWEED